MPDGRRRIDVLLPDLAGGGAEKLHLALAPHFTAAGFAHRFLLGRAAGALIGAVPGTSEVRAFGSGGGQAAAVVRLAARLRADPPAVLIANMEHQMVAAALARRLARVPTKLIMVQHNTLSCQLGRSGWRWRLLPPLLRRALRSADALVGVSNGVSDEVASFADVPRARVTTITNGVVEELAQPVVPSHTEPPTIVAIGRLTHQKGFDVLIDAMALLRGLGEVRLIILGEGALRAELEGQVERLGLGKTVALPGFVHDTRPFLQSARMLVCSSLYEGFGNVIVEALACGTPVISSDCPHGPAEILDHGRHGVLVPPGDPLALADAIWRQLDAHVDQGALQARALDFTIRRCASDYVALAADLLQTS